MLLLYAICIYLAAYITCFPEFCPCHPYILQPFTLSNRVVLVTFLTECCPYSTLTERPCKDGDIRLVGGNNSNEGELELCYNREWRAICDDRWDDREAIVVCRQLGFSGDFLKPYHRLFDTLTCAKLLKSNFSIF